MTLLNKQLLLVSLIPVIISLSSCAHNFDKLTIKKKDTAVFQLLKVKIKKGDEENRMTVYSQINRTRRTAILDGVGLMDNHIFTLKVATSRYSLTDYINNVKETGDLQDFKLIPLDEQTLFAKIDIKKKQPIIISSTDGSLKVEITVKEQHRLR